MSLFHIPRITKGYGVEYRSLNDCIMNVETYLDDSVNNILTFEGADGSDLIGGVWNRLLLGNVKWTANGSNCELIKLYSPVEFPEQGIVYAEVAGDISTGSNWELILQPTGNVFPMRDMAMVEHVIMAVNGPAEGSFTAYFQTMLSLGK